MLSANTGRLSIPEDDDTDVIILKSESGNKYILISDFSRSSNGRIILRKTDTSGVSNLEVQDRYQRRVRDTARDITYLEDEDLYVEEWYDDPLDWWYDIPAIVAFSTYIAVSPEEWEIKEKMKIDNVDIPPGIEEWVEENWCGHDAGKVLEKTTKQNNTESPTDQHRDIFRWFWEGARFSRFGYWTIKDIADGTGINQSSVSARMTEERFDDLRDIVYFERNHPKQFALKPGCWLPKPNQDTILSFK